MLTGSVFLLVFLHGLIQENFNIYCESIGIKCFDYWYFSCIQRKNEIHLPRHCKSHIVFGPLVFWHLCLFLLNICVRSVWILLKISLTFINNIPIHFHFVLRIYTSMFYCFHLSFLFYLKLGFCYNHLSYPLWCVYIVFTSLIVWRLSVDSISKPISDTIILA